MAKKFLDILIHQWLRFFVLYLDLRATHRRREQGEAEAARLSKDCNNNARGRQRLQLMTAVGLVVLLRFVGVIAWQQWPTQEQPRPTETAGKDQEKGPAAPAPVLAPTRRALKPLDTFMDCSECPEMVMIPGGSFTMGSSADEPGHRSIEGPQHRVTIEPFAMGKTEVTFTEWDACVTGGGCNGYKPPDPLDQNGDALKGSDRGSRPVDNVSWQDAKAYVSWLSQHTGKSYRLPSEAEWEYAARAGTTTLYSFGDAITVEDANCSKDMIGTTKVGAYPPNSWGLFDMHGNVEEWVEDSWDTWHDSYKGAPTDGTAWMGIKEKTNPFSIVSGLRGGSWRSGPMLSDKAPHILMTCRAASRRILPRGARTDDIGFRVARTLY